MVTPTLIRQLAARDSLTRLTASLIFLAALGLASTVSAAQVKVQNVLAQFSGGDGTNGIDGAFTQTAASGDVFEIADISVLGSGGRAFAYSSLGVLKSSTSAGASRANISNGMASTGYARADASWYDTVTLTGAGLAGTGLANVRLFVDAPSGGVTNNGTTGLGGSFSATAAANFSFKANSVPFTFNTQARLTHMGTDLRQTFTKVNSVNHIGDLGGFWDLSIPFTFGQVFAIEASIVTTTFASAGTNSTASSFADFGNSIYWDGITSITLADGSTTSAFSALGSSGNDWKVSAVPEPVPEPSSAFLLLLGLGVLARLPAFRRRLSPRG